MLIFVLFLIDVIDHEPLEGKVWYKPIGYRFKIIILFLSEINGVNGVENSLYNAGDRFLGKIICTATDFCRLFRQIAKDFTFYLFFECMRLLSK